MIWLSWKKSKISLVLYFLRLNFDKLYIADCFPANVIFMTAKLVFVYMYYICLFTLVWAYMCATVRRPKNIVRVSLIVLLLSSEKRLLTELGHTSISLNFVRWYPGFPTHHQHRTILRFTLLLGTQA